MAKRKAESLSSQGQTTGPTGSKKLRASVPAVDRKKSNLLDDSDSDSGSTSDSCSDGGVKVEQLEFKINQDYAKRFEHNKKREELQRRRCIYCPLVFSRH